MTLRIVVLCVLLWGALLIPLALAGPEPGKLEDDTAAEPAECEAARKALNDVVTQSTRLGAYRLQLAAEAAGLEEVVFMRITAQVNTPEVIARAQAVYSPSIRRAGNAILLALGCEAAAE